MRFGVRLALGGVVAVAAAAAGIYLSSAAREHSSDTTPFAKRTRPKEVPAIAFQDGAGQRRSLADFRGRVVLLNVWATWCAPCREEMPALDRLQAKLGGPGFEVVALSIDQQGPAIVRRFYGELGIKALQLYIDPSAQAGFKLATVGIPTTLLVDRAGREIGRHTGPAKWDAPQIVEDLRRRINGAEG